MWRVRLRLEDRPYGRDCDEDEYDRRNQRPEDLELRASVRLRRARVVIYMAIPQYDDDQRRLDEDEDDGAEEQKAVPESVDVTTQLRVRAEGRVGMIAGARARSEREENRHRERCEPPQAVSAFHLIGSRWDFFHVNRLQGNAARPVRGGRGRP